MIVCPACGCAPDVEPPGFLMEERQRNGFCLCGRTVVQRTPAMGSAWDGFSVWLESDPELDEGDPGFEERVAVRFMFPHDGEPFATHHHGIEYRGKCDPLEAYNEFLCHLVMRS